MPKRERRGAEINPARVVRHKGEGLHFESVRASRRPLAMICRVCNLPARIQQLFETRLQPVYFIDEQDLFLLHVGDDRRQIPLIWSNGAAVG